MSQSDVPKNILDLLKKFPQLALWDENNNLKDDKIYDYDCFCKLKPFIERELKNENFYEVKYLPENENGTSNVFTTYSVNKNKDNVWIPISNMFADKCSAFPEQMLKYYNRRDVSEFFNKNIDTLLLKLGFKPLYYKINQKNQARKFPGMFCMTCLQVIGQDYLNKHLKLDEHLDKSMLLSHLSQNEIFFIDSLFAYIKEIKINFAFLNSCAKVFLVQWDTNENIVNKIKKLLEHDDNCLTIFKDFCEENVDLLNATSNIININDNSNNTINLLSILKYIYTSISNKQDKKVNKEKLKINYKEKNDKQKKLKKINEDNSELQDDDNYSNFGDNLNFSKRSDYK